MEQMTDMELHGKAAYESDGQKPRQTKEKSSMPHLIMGNVSSTRIVSTERTQDFYFKYYVPISRSEPLTTELLALTPDPYFVVPPERGDMPEIFGENLGVWTVKESVKNIVEELEPGVHTFIPVNLRVRNKTKDYGRYFLLYIGQTINSVVIDETQFRDGFGREGFDKSPVLNVLVGDTVLDGEAIAGRHLWRNRFEKIKDDRTLLYDELFCSDELKKRLKAIKAEGWRFRPCKVKDDQNT